MGGVWEMIRAAEEDASDLIWVWSSERRAAVHGNEHEEGEKVL